MKSSILLLLALLALLYSLTHCCTGGNVTLQSEAFVTDIAAPTFIVFQHIPGATNPLMFLGIQNGLIYMVDTQEQPLNLTVFLNITDIVIPIEEAYDERGLLSMAFHPDFLINGRFYLWYSIEGPEGASDPGNRCNATAIDHINVLAEYEATFPTSGPATVEYRRNILTENHPFSNHNGLQNLAVNERFLYLALGDGGLANDPFENAQYADRLEGKIVRFNIDTLDANDTLNCDTPLNTFTALSEACPFVSNSLDIVAIGFRNPSGLDFVANPSNPDQLIGTQYGIIVPNVGQSEFEEIEFIQKLDENYGWDFMEATHCINQSVDSCPDQSNLPLNGTLPDLSINLPVAELQHNNASVENPEAIIGGGIYSGSECQALRNRYIFGDFSGHLYYIPTGNLFELKTNVTLPSVCTDEGGEEGDFLSNYRTNNLLPVTVIDVAGNEGQDIFYRCITIGPDNVIYVCASPSSGTQEGSVLRLEPISP